jgi:hypothetical protein
MQFHGTPEAGGGDADKKALKKETKCPMIHLNPDPRD